MAKVNTKFIVILSASILGAVALAVLAMKLVFKSPAELAATAAEFAAKGEYAAAAAYQAKAVNKDQTNVKFLEQWRDYLKKYAPPDSTRAMDALSKLETSMHQIGLVQKENVQAQREYLDTVLARVTLGGEFNNDAMRALISRTEEFLNRHDTSKEGEWRALERYRAWALAQIVMASPDYKKEDFTQAELSITTALSANPDDAMVALAAEQMYLTLAARAEKAHKPADAAALTAKAAAYLDDILARVPDAPEVGLRKLERTIALGMRELGAAKDAKERMDLATRKAAEWTQQLKAIVDSVVAGKAHDADRSFRFTLRRIETILSPTSALSGTVSALAALEKSDPTDAELTLERGLALAEVGKFDEAIKAAEQILLLPAQPTSLKAVRMFDMRVSATFLSGLWMIRSADDPALKDDQRLQRITAAKDSRAKLGAMVDGEAPSLMLLNAYIAYMEGNTQEAGRFLDRFNTKTRGGDKDSQWLMYLIQTRLNNLGNAKKALDKCLQLDPQNFRAALAYADIETKLGDYDSALRVIDALLQLIPQFEPAQQLRAQILDLKGEGATTDPVVRTLRVADNMGKELSGRADADQKVLEFLIAEAAKYPDDFRMIRAVGLGYLRAGQRDQAIAAFERALAAKPDDTLTKRLIDTARANDEIEAARAVLDASGVEPIERLAKLHELYLIAGRFDDASKVLEEAKAINAEDKRVIELQFLNAFARQNFEDAQKAADVATQKNADGRNGLTFRARLLAAKGDFPGAISAIEQAMNMGNPGPELFRLLGRTHMSANNTTEAVKAFQSAIDARPNDVSAINGLLNAYIQLRRLPDALTLAKNSEKYAAGDPDFRHMYDAVEAQVGDKSLAISRRERSARSAPNDRRNLLALAGLYIEAKRWSDARQAIESARKVKDGDDLVVVLASWHWMQDQKAEARKVYTDLIASRQGEPALDATIGLASFLLSNGEAEEGLKVLRDARSLQDPVRVQIDRALADTLYFQGKYEEAATSIKAVIDASKESRIGYFHRYAECLIRSGKAKEALAVLAPLAKPGQEDLATLLYTANAHSVLNDIPAERAALDQAVSRFSNEAIVFKRRGEFLLSQRPPEAATQLQYARDAKEDFDVAIRLNPNDWETYRYRALAQIAIDQDRGYAGAVKDFREALRLNPGSDEMYYGLVADLLRKNPPRTQEAMAVAEEGLARRTGDTKTLVSLGELFSQSAQFPEAIRFLRMAFDLDNKNAEVTQRLLDALLKSKPPLLQDAEAVLQRVQAQVERNPGFLMAFAKIRISQNRLPEADNFAVKAVALLDPKNSRQMLAWFNDIQSVQPDKAKVVAFLDNISSMGVRDEAGEWLKFLKANLLASDAATEKDGKQILQSLTTDAKLPVLSQLSYRVLGSGHYAAGRHAEAAAVWEQALSKFPEDFESMNNLAYVYLKHLNRPVDALKWAEIAAVKIKASSDVQDTYGLALAANGRGGEALAIFRNALLLAETPLSEVTICVHLAEALMKGDNRNDATDVVKRAMATVAESPDQISDEVKSELQALKKDLGL